MKRIYFDNASTTPIHPAAIEKMKAVMEEHFGNPSSIHYHGRITRSIIEDARKTVANVLHASVGEIFFTSSATEANNTVLQKCVEDLNVKVIITAPTEHHCILHTLDYISTKSEVKILYLKVDTRGKIDMEELDQLLNENNEYKCLVSIMHGNNEIGTIQNIKEIGDLCKKHNALFHTDAVQTVGKLDINVSEMSIGFLTSSAHKFHGPKGIGFLYMNSDNIISPMIYGGAQERNFRAGTENIIGIVGLAEALKQAMINREEKQNKLRSLKMYLIDQLALNMPDVKINGALGDEALHHIVSVSFPQNAKGDMLMFNLDIAGISASSGSACSSGIERDSHVLVAIGHESERKTIRFSFSHNNTLEEIEQLIEILHQITND